MVDLKMLEEKTPILKEICSEKEVFWKNPDKTVCGEAMEQIELGMEDVEDAERRLERFAPFIMKCFPETKERNGIIESVLTPVPKMKDLLNEKYDSNLEGNLLLKQDSHLAIAGSIKARGGIYEILKHTEELALEHGFLSLEDNYEKLASEECRVFQKVYHSGGFHRKPWTEYRNHECSSWLSGDRTHVSRCETVEKRLAQKPRGNSKGI